MKLIFLIPAYNEQATLGKVIRSLPKKLSRLQCETLVIDDGSTDKTVAIAKKAGSQVVSLQQNQGVGRALQIGFETALQHNADFVITFDADGQFSPQDIPVLLVPLLQGKVAVTLGSRFFSPDITPVMPWQKKFGNQFMAWLLSILIKRKITDATCGFRAYNREALRRLQLFGSYTYTQEVILQLYRHQLAFQEVPVHVKPTERPDGKSRVVTSLAGYAFRALIILLRAFRDLDPFGFFGVPALTLGTLGFLGGLFTFFHYLQTGKITPYKGLGIVAVFLLTTALILFIFALLADMIDRLRSQQEKILYELRK